MKHLLWRIGSGLLPPLVATLALAALVVWSFRYTQTVSSDTSRKASARTRQKNKTEDICTDLVLSQNGSRVDLARIGRAYTRRLRKGPISLPVRELVAERLDLILPETYFHPLPDASVPAQPSDQNQAARIFDTLATDSSRLSALLPSVAGLRIKGLRIGRLADDTNVVPWLQAASGSLNDGRTLALRDVALVEGGRTNRMDAALLAFKPFFRVMPVDK